MSADIRVLLVAQSARMLAESAARGGLRCTAIDCFGDEETAELSDACLTVPAVAEGMDAQRLLDAAERLAPADGRTGLVYGSGIDTRPDLVEKLSRGRIRFGNLPASLRLINDPPAFFRLLRELNIPYPETRFSVPESPEGWLIKPCCGEGGKGVRLLAKNRPGAGAEYYQRHIPGPVYSALFLANGGDARVVGFNTQWVQAHDPAEPFRFAGAVNRTDLSAAQLAEIAAYASSLTAAVGLLGLNSLDAVVEAGRVSVLEVNPRPSASMALYDGDYPAGLLAAHIAACRGSSLPVRVTPGPVRAFRYVFAPRRIRIGVPLAWPPWCADRPRAGTVVEAGAPLCTVCAEAPDRQAAEALLKHREAEIGERFLRGAESHRAAISSTSKRG